MATSINDLNITGLTYYDPASRSSASNALDGTSTKELQSNFLRLLTTQLQNQDPLNPMESAEMTSQLAQLNMVDGISSMNKTMTALMEQMQISDFMSQSLTVGRAALVPSNSIEFNGVTPVVIGSNFSSAVSETTIKITDSSGSLVMNSKLGPSPAGISNMYWDGLGLDGQPLPAGKYFLSITGTSGQGSVVGESLVASTVTAVGRDGNKFAMTLADGRKVSPSDVKQWVLQ
jgi:flagellar basal-body rod modification protein FlgD